MPLMTKPVNRVFYSAVDDLYDNQQEQGHDQQQPFDNGIRQEK